MLIVRVLIPFFPFRSSSLDGDGDQAALLCEFPVARKGVRIILGDFP
jgi:hypothetical protein